MNHQVYVLHVKTCLMVDLLSSKPQAQSLLFIFATVSLQNSLLFSISIFST